MKDVTYTAGRAFYLNGKLNIIIGDYDRLGDKFKERANASAGISEIKYYFVPGKRAKKSGFKLVNEAIIYNNSVVDAILNGNPKNESALL